MNQKVKTLDFQLLKTEIKNYDNKISTNMFLYQLYHLK